MSTSFDLRIGQGKVTLVRSETLLAVRQRTFERSSFDMSMRSLDIYGAPVQRGQIDDFVLLEVAPAPNPFGKAAAGLRSAPALQGIAPVYHSSGDQVPFIPAGTIFLAFTPDAPAEAKQGVLDRHGLQLVAAEEVDFLTVRVMKHDADAVEVAAQLQQEDVVRVAEPDLVTTLRQDSVDRPPDELLHRQWHLENTGEQDGDTLGLKAGADARVVRAWQKLGGLGSSAPIVAIIDDGFDLSHPDLAGKSVSPWNFATNSNDVSARPDPNSPAKGAWHGTCCAGVAVGTADGGQIVGAAPLARLLPVRMYPSLSPEKVAQWFDYVALHGAWVVSCSWGPEAAVYPLGTRVINAIARCARTGRSGKGCIVVFAAGNSSSDIDDPPRFHNGFANHPDVLAVSACSSRDEYSDYSNFGARIAVCAPSSGLGSWPIVTSDARGTYVDAGGTTWDAGYAASDYYFYFGGTSSACPLVAGICALVLDANPDLTADQVREIVKATARRIGPESEYVGAHSPKFGYGCIDAERAVQAALDLAAAPRVVATKELSSWPTSFASVIGDALSRPDATAESVATALSSSAPFLGALRLGLSQARRSGRADDAVRHVQSSLVAALVDESSRPDERDLGGRARRVQ